MTETHAPSGGSRRTAVPAGSPAPGPPAPGASVEQLPPVQDRLAAWLCDLTSLQELTEQLARTRGLEETLGTALQAGSALLGARRGLAVLEDGHGDGLGLGLDRPSLGALETVPHDAGPYAGLLDGGAHARLHVTVPDLSAPAPGLDPRYREVARQLGIGASFALSLATPEEGTFGAIAWFYDEPSEPSPRRRHLARLYCSVAAPLVARQLEQERLRRTAEDLRRGMLPDRLPDVPGVRLAARCLPGRLDRSAGSDWYDAVALPEGALGLTVGSVTGGGAGTAACMGRLRAALRAYAVLEGEDPVSVLGDLELLLKTTEPARSATAVYAYLEPAGRRLSLAGAGHCPPLLVTSFGAAFVETALSAPLGMLGCWEAPGVELGADPGDLLVLYTEGLARCCGGSLHRGQARLREAAEQAPREVRGDPDRLCDHLLTTCLGDRTAADDVVLLAARLD